MHGLPAAFPFSTYHCHMAIWTRKGSPCGSFPPRLQIPPKPTRLDSFMVMSRQRLIRSCCGRNCAGCWVMACNMQPGSDRQTHVEFLVAEMPWCIFGRISQGYISLLGFPRNTKQAVERKDSSSACHLATERCSMASEDQGVSKRTAKLPCCKRGARSSELQTESQWGADEGIRLWSTLVQPALMPEALCLLV